MTAFRLLTAACLAATLAAQSSVHVQSPRASRPRGRSKMPAVQLPPEILKLKEKCRLRLIASSDELFLDGKAEFADTAQRVLSELGPLLSRQEVHPIEIEGHSDASGDAHQNRRLSEERARAVETWLTTHDFLTPGAATVHGFGQARPIAPEMKPDGSVDPLARQKNRRVELVVSTCR